MCCIAEGQVLPPMSMWVGCPAICLDSGAPAVEGDRLRARQSRCSSIAQWTSRRLQGDSPVAPAGPVLGVDASQLLVPSLTGVLMLAVAETTLASPLPGMLLVPVASAAVASTAVASVLAFKRLVAGAMDPNSTAVSDGQLALAEVQHAMRPVLSWLGGTEMMSAVLRAMGGRVGAGVYLGRLPDLGHNLITVGDHAVVEGTVSVASLNLAGVVDVAEVEIGPRSTVSALSHVSAGAELEEGAAVGIASLLSKVRVALGCSD